MNEELERKVEESETGETDTARLRRILKESVSFKEWADSLSHDFMNILTVISGYAELAHYCPETASKYYGLTKEYTLSAVSLIRQYLSKTDSVQAKASLLHTLNNTLTPILGGAELGMKPSERRKDIHAQIFAGLEKAVSLITELQVFANADVPGVMQPVRTTHVIETVLMQYINPKVRIHKKYEEGSNYVPATEPELARVYKSLIKNAVEAGADCIYTQVYRKSETICASILDNGCGITEEAITRIFEPFYTTKFQNLGLGLATSKKIIEKYGGRIIFESHPKEGSIFTVELPACEKKDS